MTAESTMLTPVSVTQTSRDGDSLCDANKVSTVVLDHPSTTSAVTDLLDGPNHDEELIATTEDDDEETPGHPQAKVMKDGLVVEVDIELASILTALWKAGIKTTTSCQEGKPGYAFIEFPTAKDVTKFLNLVAQCPLEQLYAADSEQFRETLYCRVHRYGSQHDWEYQVEPDDVTHLFRYTFFVDDPRMDKSVYELVITVWFPTSDISLIRHALKEQTRMKKR